MAAAVPFLPAIASVGATLFGSSKQQAPQLPSPQAAPPPPPPTVSSAPDVQGGSPVLDTEAARQRAQKRRRATEQKKILGLTGEDSTSKSTKSLLGGD